MTAPPDTMASLVRARAERSPDDVALCTRRDGRWTPCTWASLWEDARRVASGLAAAGLRPGDHALFLLPEVELAVPMLFGAWALGVVPAMVGVPFRLTDVARFVDGLRDTARRLDARALVTSRALAAFATDAEALPVIAAEDLLAHDVAPFAVARASAAPALIQPTSGSTGRPRGVVLAHDRLLTHVACVSAALPADASSVGLSWLPLHHDMGLVGGLLYPLVNGFVVHLLPPADFRARPFSWLEAMSELRATMTAAPPSAYAVAARLAPRAAAAGLCFDAWACAMVGAEPVRPAALRRFAEGFAPLGFRAEAFFPVYGLAEATVAVTFPRPLAPTRVDVVDRDAIEREGRAAPCDASARAMEFVSVGAPIPRTEVRITAGDGGALPERRVGEIVVRSPSLMVGYHDEPEATAAALRDGWLHTGDLGYLADGELFVTGRVKDVILRGGHGILPTAVEEAASEVEGVRAGCVAAVGVPDEDTERCVVLAETHEAPSAHAALEARVRGALEARGLFVDRVVLLPPGALPRTTSGKLRRRAVADALAAGRALEAAE
ncbi:MAG: AMP-binding protein [Polyangiales bacterium]